MLDTTQQSTHSLPLLKTCPLSSPRSDLVSGRNHRTAHLAGRTDAAQVRFSISLPLRTILIPKPKGQLLTKGTTIAGHEVPATLCNMFSYTHRKQSLTGDAEALETCKVRAIKQRDYYSTYGRHQRAPSVV